MLPIDRDRILSIPLNYRDVPDRRRWFFDKGGAFIVKSGYRVAFEDFCSSNRESSSLRSSQKWWQVLWNLNIPPKVKIFVWRAC